MKTEVYCRRRQVQSEILKAGQIAKAAKLRLFTGKDEKLTGTYQSGKATDNYSKIHNFRCVLSIIANIEHVREKQIQTHP